MAGALFALFQAVGRDGSLGLGQADEIVVTAGRVLTLTASFEQLWKRAPTAGELDGLIEEYVREEVLYREALALGLDRDDTIVRRRLGQKMEFLSEDTADLKEASEPELEAFLAANAESYRQDARFSFRQIYFSAHDRGDSAAEDARAMLTQLREHDRDASQLGDSIMVKHRFENASEREVARVLGATFLAAIREAPVGTWLGPVDSGLGLHLVHISERVDGKASELDQVRHRVERDWLTMQRKRANEAFFTELRKRYKVTVRMPVPTPTTSSEGAGATGS